ncbi:MAG: hypothetical protein P1U34_05770 [Coxiellaceae bacterium]|nr:hypothetical protein [Coxiellaceae bacterium]
MSITAEELAILAPGQFAFLENMAGGFDQCKQVLMHSPFHGLEEASYFFNKDSGIMHNMLQALESIDNPEMQTLLLLHIIHQNKTAAIEELLEKIRLAGVALNDLQCKAVIVLQQILHNITVDDPFHFNRQAGSLVIHMEQNPGNIFSRLADPVNDIRLKAVQTGLRDMVNHLAQKKLEFCISSHISQIKINFCTQRRLPSDLELHIIDGLQHELWAIHQSPGLNPQQQLMAIHYRLYRALQSLTTNPTQYALTPRSQTALCSTLQQACEKLNQLIIPNQALAMQHKYTMRFLQGYKASDLPASDELSKELEHFQTQQAHITTVIACIDTALASAKATNGFDTATARAQYLVFENDILSLDAFLKLDSSSEGAIYKHDDERNVTTKLLNKYFRITPANGALYSKRGLLSLEDAAHRARQTAKDPLLRTPLEYSTIADCEVDCFEINRLLNLQRLKNRPDLCAQIKPELRNANHLGKLANLPKQCFLNDSVQLLNLFNPVTMTEQTIEYIGSLVDEYSVFNTYRILEYCNAKGINWSLLASIPKPCLDATIGSADPVASLLQSLQDTHNSLQQAITACNTQLQSWDPRIFCYRTTIQQQLQKHMHLNSHVERLLPTLIPEPAAPHVAALA